MAPHPLLLRIANGENEVLDFKKTISSAPKIAKTLSAFANHKGGTLLVGVNDNKTISGVRSEEEKYMLELAAGFHLKPPITLEIREWDFGGKIVLEAIVPEGNQKPYYAKDEEGKWWVHIRVNDQSLLASKVVVEVLKRNSGNQVNIIKYSEKEEAVLKGLDKSGRLTLKEICKMLNISRWRAQKMLVSLVSAGVIRSHTTEKEEFFTLS
jgi:predicted HTH transcriptional regulator